MKDPKQSLLIASVAISVMGIGLISFTLYRLAGMGQDVSQVRNELRIVLSKLRTEDDGLIDEPTPDEQVRFATVSDAESLVKKLGEKPSAERLAEAILTTDGWLIKPGDEEAFKKFKLAHQARLRKLVKEAVSARQEASLRAATSAEGAKEHADAGRILAMYPVSDQASVVEEAKSLAARQAEVVGRLEALRRQRYNRWATDQIEKAIDFYNANVSHFNPFNDNAVLIDSLVKNLREVDPAGLEPAVLELSDRHGFWGITASMLT